MLNASLDGRERHRLRLWPDEDAAKSAIETWGNLRIARPDNGAYIVPLRRRSTRCSEGEVVSHSAHLQAGKRNPRQYSRRSLLPAAWKLTSECRLEERCRALRRVVGRARKLRA